MKPKGLASLVHIPQLKLRSRSEETDRNRQECCRHERDIFHGPCTGEISFLVPVDMLDAQLTNGSDE